MRSADFGMRNLSNLESFEFGMWNSEFEPWSGEPAQHRNRNRGRYRYRDRDRDRKTPRKGLSLTLGDIGTHPPHDGKKGTTAKECQSLKSDNF